MALQAHLTASTFLLQSPSTKLTSVSTKTDDPRSKTRFLSSRSISTAVSSSSSRFLPRSSTGISIPEVGTVTEVGNDTFWPLVDAARDKIIVLDMYTQWCGPCKLIAPKYEALSKKYTDVLFFKLDCNHENRPLAKELGIRVVPTFKIFKNGLVVKEVTGAKIDDLIIAIETARSS